MLIGAQAAGWLFNGIVDANATNLVQLAQYKTFWMIPAAFAAVVMVIFGLFFKEDNKKKSHA